MALLYLEAVGAFCFSRLCEVRPALCRLIAEDAADEAGLVIIH